MKSIKKIIIGVICACFFGSIMGNVSLAAGTGSIKISSASGQVFSTVTVKGTISSSNGPLAAAKVVMSYKSNGLQYVSGSGGTFNVDDSAGSIQYGVMGSGSETSFSFSMTFKILKEGSWEIKIGNYQVVDLENAEELVITATSGTITGKTATTSNNNTNNNSNSNNNNTQDKKDTNNKLNSLSVYPGTLSPAFSADTTSYTVTVSEDVTEVTFSAAAQSSKASVSVSGGKDLKLGENTAQVVVISESGASRTYNITIMCGEAEKIQIGGTDNTINESFTEEQIPTGFSKTEVTYNDRQYAALTDASGTLQLMSLQSGETSNFYIYNEDTQEFYPFVQVEIAEGKYIVLLQSEGTEEFAFEMSTITVQDKVLEAWKIDEEFSIVRALTQEGTVVFYKYDSVDGTFQRYAEVQTDDEAQEVVEEKTIFPNEYYMYAIVGLGALVIILSISMIYFVASRKHRHEARKRKAQKKAEKQRAKEEKQRAKKEAELAKQRAKEEEVLAKQRAKEEKQLEKQRKKEKKVSK